MISINLKKIRQLTEAVHKLPAFALVSLSAAGGAYFYETYRQLQAGHQGGSVFDNVARDLQRDQAYVIQVVIDPKIAGWRGIVDRAKASSKIRKAFEALGWQINGVPLLRNEEEAKKFFAGEPNQWLLTGTWTKAETKQGKAPAWTTMTLPYLLPVEG